MMGLRGLPIGDAGMDLAWLYGIMEPGWMLSEACFLDVRDSDRGKEAMLDTDLDLTGVV